MKSTACLSLRKIFLAFGLFSLFSSCANDGNSPSKTSPLPQQQRVVQEAAASQGVNSRLLQSAMYVKGGFAEDQQQNEIQTEKHASFYLNSEEMNFSKLAKDLAKSIKEQSKISRPSTTYDWLMVAAQSLVETNTDPRFSSAAVAIALNELVYIYNNGFTIQKQNGEIIDLPEQSGKIDVSKLDPIRNGWLNAGRSDSVISYPGNEAAEITEKPVKETPKFHIRWCAKTALKCFDELRKSSTVSPHFIAIRSAFGGLRLVRLHPILKDLSWYDSVQDNTISIALTGSPDFNAQFPLPSWLKFDDFTSIRSMIIENLSALTKVSSGISNAKPQDLIVPYINSINSNPDEYPSDPSQEPAWQAESNAVLASVPEGMDSFELPKHWDHKLIQEAISSEKDQAMNAISIEKKEILSNQQLQMTLRLAQPELDLSFHVDTVQGSGWDLIRKTRTDKKAKTYQFQEFLFNDSTDNGKKVRTLRIAARNSIGQLVGIIFHHF